MSLLLGLNDEQRKAVVSEHNKILCLAGAGAGKTKVLTTRVAYLYEQGVSPENILCLTFTRLAGYEMKKRIIELIGKEGENLYCNTFHGFCVNVFKKYGYLIGLDENFVIYDNTEREQLIKKIIKDLRLKGKVKPADVEGLIDGTIKPSIKLVSAKRVADEYCFTLKRNNATDINLLLTDTVQLFKEHEEVTAYYHNKYKYVFVDEFQDTNDVQMEFLKLLNPENIFLVGDDFQAIYGWRNAKVKYIIDLATNPEFEVIKIRTNYRSTQPIIDAANLLIKYNTKQIPKELITDKNGDIIEFIECKNPYEEALFVGEQIMATDKPFKDFAVLARTNRQLEVFEDIFKEFHIPYNIVCAQEDIFSHPDIKTIFCCILASQNLYNDTMLQRVISTQVSEEDLRQIEYKAITNSLSIYETIKTMKEPKIITLLNILNEMQEVNMEDDVLTVFASVRDIMYEMLIDTDMAAYVECESKIKEWVQIQQEIDGDTSMKNFLMWLKTRDYDGTELITKDEVKLLTVHAAKGLEFNTVFIIGMNQGMFPLHSSDIEEERRLFYVALTRAKEKLYVTRPIESQNLYTRRIEKHNASQFIKEMGL